MKIASISNRYVNLVNADTLYARGLRSNLRLT